MGEREKALFLLPENQGQLIFGALPLVINYRDTFVFIFLLQMQCHL